MSNLFKSCLMLGVCLLSPTWAFAAIKEYHLNIDEKTINLTGKAVKKNQCAMVSFQHRFTGV